MNPTLIKPRKRIFEEKGRNGSKYCWIWIEKFGRNIRVCFCVIDAERKMWEKELNFPGKSEPEANRVRRDRTDKRSRAFLYIVESRKKKDFSERKRFGYPTIIKASEYQIYTYETHLSLSKVPPLYCSTNISFFLLLLFFL